MLLMCPLRLVSKLQRSQLSLGQLVLQRRLCRLDSSPRLSRSRSLSCLSAALSHPLSLPVLCLYFALCCTKVFGLFIDFVTVVASSKQGWLRAVCFMPQLALPMPLPRRAPASSCCCPCLVLPCLGLVQFNSIKQNSFPERLQWRVLDCCHCSCCSCSCCCCCCCLLPQNFERAPLNDNCQTDMLPTHSD